jgi:hypothetical protein
MAKVPSKLAAKLKQSEEFNAEARDYKVEEY